MNMASGLYALRPWYLMDESKLILVPDLATGETCHCSVMGALGEIVSVYAYIGTEGYRLFRKMAAGKISGPGELYASQKSVFVEFVGRTVLELPDRKLLAALGHTPRKGQVSPIFRSVRPGFYPWFVTEGEAETLAECMRAVTLISSALS